MQNLLANETFQLKKQIFNIRDKLLSLSQNLSNYNNELYESNSTAHFLEEEQSEEDEEKSFSKLHLTIHQTQNQTHQFKKLKPLFKVKGKSVQNEPLQRLNRHKCYTYNSGRQTIIRYSLQRDHQVYMSSPQRKLTYSMRVSVSPFRKF